MRHGYDRPLAFIGDAITTGWGAYRAEAARARGVHLPYWIDGIAEAGGPVCGADPPR